MGGILVASDKDARRVKASVNWTEEYQERVQGLFTDSPRDDTRFQKPYPLRGVLLQNVYDGKDGLIQLIGRDGINSGFMVEIVGKNIHPSDNAFKLRLYGANTDPNNPSADPVLTLIGTSERIPCISTALDMLDHLITISPNVLNTNNISVGLGNPYESFDLQVYGDVVPGDAAVAATVRIAGTPATPPSSYVGAWYIRIDSYLFPEHEFLVLTPLVDEEAGLTGLTQITSRISKDLLSPETTLATDTDYRTADYPWQVGTIASCLDYADVGFGIIRSTFRNFSVV